MSDSPCGSCGGPVPLEWVRCPHCALPGLFPNVRAAREKAPELEERYRTAMSKAAARGCTANLKDFEAVAGTSHAVIARPIEDVMRLAGSDRQLYATFYELTQGESRLSFGDDWDRKRRIADEALFPGYKEKIRFAALSLDGSGVPEFGACSLSLREELIAHRASVFEDNSAVLLHQRGYGEPPASRATWEERGKLCAAKAASEIGPNTGPSEFPGILLRRGATGTP